jgi:hypothetical protein
MSEYARWRDLIQLRPFLSPCRGVGRAGRHRLVKKLEMTIPEAESDHEARPDLSRARCYSLRRDLSGNPTGS